MKFRTHNKEEHSSGFREHVFEVSIGRAGGTRNREDSIICNTVYISK